MAAFLLPYSKSIVLNTTVALIIIASLFVIGLIRWRLLNQKLLDVEQNARTNLELKVHERTAQLRNTMRELERANRQLATLSLHDALTGLHNRRHLDNLLPELCAESRRSGQPLTIALLDADHFKAVNDDWGHGFGDQCLQHIAEILRRHVKRPRDVAIRFGGEEFAILLPGTGADGAHRLCEQILEDLASTRMVTSNEEYVTVTMSAGTATLVPGGTVRPDLLPTMIKTCCHVCCLLDHLVV